MGISVAELPKLLLTAAVRYWIGVSRLRLTRKETELRLDSLYDAKTDEIAARRLKHGHAHGGAGVSRRVQPGASTQNATGFGISGCGRFVSAVARITLDVRVFDPFQDVPNRVIQSPGIWTIAPDFRN